MEKVIIIKYGELNTKKGNIKFFLEQLRQNLLFALDGIKVNINFDKGRMYIETLEFDKALDAISHVFGIHEVTIGYKVSDDFELIEKSLLEALGDRKFKTFKVEARRSNKQYIYDSMEISRKMGGYLLKNIKDISVDVHNPELLINVEIRKGFACFYFDSIPCLGGYPVGSLGKGLLMLSGGIDSPVAGYLGIKRGVKLECIYFEAPPHTSLEAKNKVLELARLLALYNNDIKVHVINFTEIEEAIYKDIPNDYLITIMRRMMYRISEIIAHKNNCKAIINGESIGQVASQTLNSMGCINEVVKIPVIRPVACFDKLEIISLALKIGTYKTSILPFEDCCTIFVPKHPVINPYLSTCREYEELIPYKDMIYKAVKEEEVIRIKYKQEKDFADLL